MVTKTLVKFGKGWRIVTDPGNIIIQRKVKGKWVDRGYYMSFEFAVHKLVDEELKVLGLSKAKDIIKRLESIERMIKKGLKT